MPRFDLKYQFNHGRKVIHIIKKNELQVDARR